MASAVSQRANVPQLWLDGTVDQCTKPLMIDQERGQLSITRETTQNEPTASLSRTCMFR